jgi:hypothetical protein
VLTIFTTFTSTTSPCGAAYNIWAFCLSVVVVIPVLGCLTSIVANLTAMPGLMAVPPVINLAMALWGMYLWSQMGDKCMMALEAGYWDLVLLFKINVILLSISFFVFICILCLGAAFLGGAAATGGRGLGGGGGGYVGLLGRDGESGMQEGGVGGGGGGRGHAATAVTSKDQQLRTAAMLGHLSDVELLLREGASVSTTDATNGWTALHYAAASGRTEVVLKLVQVGANIDAATASGETAMMLASGHPSVEALLKSLGAADSVKRDIV